ncbi:hypothetical protein ASC63_09570 [Leifsonia sp. Root112D2]|nr:hypothetical protein ASC63_09570 [Leifsonia sp. Root112D2]
MHRHQSLCHRLLTILSPSPVERTVTSVGEQVANSQILLVFLRFKPNRSRPAHFRYERETSVQVTRWS